ncbi:MAG TPA: hypothetical protein VF104_00230, partial [Burkholderiales bacterium]
MTMEDEATPAGRETGSGMDTLVHLGAGLCSELDDYLAMGPRRLLLVEADPELAEALTARMANVPQAQVICAAVAGRPGAL